MYENFICSLIEIACNYRYMLPFSFSTVVDTIVVVVFSMHLILHSNVVQSSDCVEENTHIWLTVIRTNERCKSQFSWLNPMRKISQKTKKTNIYSLLVPIFPCFGTQTHTQTILLHTVIRSICKQSFKWRLWFVIFFHVDWIFLVFVRWSQSSRNNEMVSIEMNTHTKNTHIGRLF